MMGHNNAIRNDDGIIENQLWKVRKDEEGNDRIVAGIKVIYNDSTKRENDLPIESNTAEAYFKADVNGNIIQLRIYDTVTHKAVMDIDFMDEHKNKRTGEVFESGVAHVQEFKMKDGVPIRISHKARYMTDIEIARWRGAILQANPYVRFR